MKAAQQAMVTAPTHTPVAPSAERLCYSGRRPVSSAFKPRNAGSPSSRRRGLTAAACVQGGHRALSVAHAVSSRGMVGARYSVAVPSERVHIANGVRCNAMLPVFSDIRDDWLPCPEQSASLNIRRKRFQSTW